MSKQEKAFRERAIIIKKKSKRPYGVRTLIRVKTAASIGNTNGVSHFVDNGQILTITPTDKAPWEGGEKYYISLVGFPTATKAEKSGRKLAQALLWTSVSMNFDLRLESNRWEATNVFERTRSGGAVIQAYGTIGWSVDRVLNEIHDAYIQLPEPDPAILLSMEIFAGARLEISQRSRFLTIVSALEPLANNRRSEKPLNPEVIEFIDSCIDLLNTDKSMAKYKDQKKSTRDRLNYLKTESIRQSILRLIRETLSKSEVAIVDNAYDIRSQIVHDGQPKDLDIDLNEIGDRVSDIIRELYSAIFQRNLYGRK